MLLLVIVLPFAAPANVKDRVNETFFGRQYGGEIKVGRVGLDLSTTERLRSWQYVLKDWLHSPLIGRGVTGYAWADAQYVKILGETGLAGLVAFIFLIVRLWRRARETFLAEQDPFCKGLAQGLLLGYGGHACAWHRSQHLHYHSYHGTLLAVRGARHDLATSDIGTRRTLPLSECPYEVVSLLLLV